MKIYKIHRHCHNPVSKNMLVFIKAKDKKSALKKAMDIYGYRFEYTFKKI